MPRQPFLPSFATKNYAIGALVLEKRPDLCALVGKCIVIWGSAENEMGNLFGLLLGTNSDAALEVFMSLRRFSNQRDALLIAGEHVLCDMELTTFRALVSVYKSLETQRNNLAHGVHGLCDEEPDALLWISVAHHVHFQTEILRKLSNSTSGEDPHARLKENLFVYRVNDLNSIYDDMEQFWRAAFYFNGYIRDRKNPGRISEYKQLRDFPQIRQAIENLGAERR